MKQFIPGELSLLEYWLLDCYSCVKWHNSWSEMFISPLVLDRVLFCRRFCFPYIWMTIEDIAKLSRLTRGVSVVRYADDIILLGRSVYELQKLLVISVNMNLIGLI